MDTYNNAVLEKLPAHLTQFVVSQHYERYSPVDQAVWRYVMRQNYAYLKDVAYYPYIPGLRKAGLTIERIPDLQSMNDSLSKIGWGAVTVDGFIPPAAFMEFQAHRVLVIAADIRQLEHIAYTPAPDIIHESSGHAPIIGEPEYADYLQYFGEIGSKAMFSKQDFELYEAIRTLSILKERADVSGEELNAAEQDLADIQQHMGEPSEMALLSRLHWWTVEYGLIGSLENPKIYGAGLLSSIGESASCMQPDVPKLPYTSAALQYPYDITKAQPQLFVTPEFAHLRRVLDEFADTMAFRVGGKQSLDKAIASENTCTAVLNTGLQISGTFVSSDKGDVLRYVQTSGPTALAYQNRQLPKHGKSAHLHGFGSPVGRVEGLSKPLSDYNLNELMEIGFHIGQPATLSYTTGIVVRGILMDIVHQEDKLCLLSFRDCTVVDTRASTTYFEPSWGSYDLAVGEEIIAVFSGAADKVGFEQHVDKSAHQTVSVPADDKIQTLQKSYAAIRQLRESQEKAKQLVSDNSISSVANVDSVLSGAWEDKPLQVLFLEHNRAFPEDWLGLVELLELAVDRSDGLMQVELEKTLQQIAHNKPSLRKMIDDGIRLAKDRNIELLL